MSVHGCYRHKACLYNNVHIFYVPPSKNVLPVNINDSTMIKDSRSQGGAVVAMSQQNGKCWDLQDSPGQAVERTLKTWAQKYIIYQLRKTVRKGCNMNCLRGFTDVKEQRQLPCEPACQKDKRTEVKRFRER